MWLLEKNPEIDWIGRIGNLDGGNRRGKSLIGINVSLGFPFF